MVLVVAGLHLLPDYRALAGPAFAYAFLYAVVRLPLRWRPRWDLSYGIYVWHWPIALVLSAAGLADVAYAPADRSVAADVQRGYARKSDRRSVQ